MRRCPWGETNDLYIKYHDEEWGVPVHDDRKHFEFLTLEAAQAGLSWLTILRKREGYRKAYNHFHPLQVSKYGDKDIARLLQDEGIVRNHKKIEASVNNARMFIEIKKEFGSFDNYIWRFVGYKPVVNRWKDVKAIPSKTALSDQISKDLMKRGFRFVGSTITYAYLQAIGIVNDHIVSCFRYPQIISLPIQSRK
jgi:DNA-3-methyladenine glycosylase I